MALGLIIGAIGSVAGGAISASGSKKGAEAEAQAQQDLLLQEFAIREEAVKAAKKERERLLDRFNFSDNPNAAQARANIFGTKPRAELYNPVDISASHAAAVADNLNIGLPAALDMSTAVNERLASDSLRLNLDRINTLNPDYGQNLETLTGATGALLRGELPYEDVLDIVSDRSELSNTLGTPGGSAPATLKDLGLNRLQAIQTGEGMFQRTQQTLASSVSPIPNYMRGDQAFPYTMIQPRDRVNFDITQAVLDQQSRQSAAFLEAAPNPAAAAIFNAKYYANQSDAATLAGFQPGSVNFGGLSAGYTAGAAAFGQGISDALGTLGGGIRANNQAGGTTSVSTQPTSVQPTSASYNPSPIWVENPAPAAGSY